MQIPASRLDRAYLKYQKEFEEKTLEVLRSGWYIMGEELERFEKNYAAWVGTKYCIGVASGLDALILAVRALGIGEGDEVLVQANTFIASVMGISINGATPVFVEPDEYYGIDAQKLQDKITEKTKAILVVHLYGQACNMDQVQKVCKDNHLYLIEDCAQSHGATWNGQMTGTFGDVACFSFYPGKNLGAFGDAGAVVTNDAQLDRRIRMLRNYGSEKRYHNKEVGLNSRLDELQAGLLDVRLQHMGEMTSEKQLLAERYTNGIENPLIALPRVRTEATHVWHQYVIRCEQRDKLKTYLEENGIGTTIHYPIPPHMSEAYAYLGYHKGDLPIAEKYADEVLSLPTYYGMTEEEQQYVIDTINAFEAE